MYVRKSHKKLQILEIQYKNRKWCKESAGQTASQEKEMELTLQID